jgi:hypothetical protein
MGQCDIGSIKENTPVPACTEVKQNGNTALRENELFSTLTKVVYPD